MILRKPYAFFIKHFKIFHIILASLVVFSLIRITGVVSFINNYMESNSGVITKTDFHKVYGMVDFIVPILTLMFNLLLLIVMGMKKKPNKFYAFATLITIILLSVNIYGYFTVKKLITVWLDVNQVNTLGDIYIFVLFALVAEAAVAVSRAIGFNVSRFDFNNDILELELSEKDNEEFEIMVDFDVNDLKRSAQKRLRYFRYFIKGNKKTIMWSFAFLVGFIGIFLAFSVYKNKKNTVGIGRYRNNINSFNIVYNNSYIVDADSNGNKIKDNIHLLVLDVTLSNNDKKRDRQFLTGTIGINIGDDNYTVTKKYRNIVKDLGVMYSDETIKSMKSSRRLLVFEVPENRLHSKIYFTLKDLSSGEKMFAKINPTNFTNAKSESVTKKLKEEMNIKDSVVGDAKINIKSAEFANYYPITYKYCTTDNKVCMDSLEYLFPDNSYTNFDKTILKIDGNFEFDKNGSIKNLGNLINNYGYIEYEINNKKYIQNNGIEHINSTRVINNNNYYLGVKDEIAKANKVSLVFKLRNNEYRYVIKEMG